MANVLGSFSRYIKTGGERVPTTATAFFAFVGSGLTNVAPKLRIRLTITVYDDLSVYISTGSQKTFAFNSKTGPLIGHRWKGYLFFSNASFTLYSGNAGTHKIPYFTAGSGSIKRQLTSWNIYNPVSGGYPTLEFPSFNIKIGKITDFATYNSQSQAYTGGTIYIGGMTYDPDYATSHPATIYGVSIDISEIIQYLDYFPGEIYTTNSQAQSCNRSGGYFKKYTSSSNLTDRKNRFGNLSKSTVLIYGENNTLNIVAPKIGVE